MQLSPLPSLYVPPGHANQQQYESFGKTSIPRIQKISDDYQTHIEQSFIKTLSSIFFYNYKQINVLKE